MRPQGSVLVACLAVMVGMQAGLRRAALFLLAAAIPLGAWLTRNRLLTGTLTSYLHNWTTFSGMMPGLSGKLAHAAEVLRTLVAGGPLGLGRMRLAVAFPSAAALSALAAWGAVGVWRSGRKTLAAGLSLYVVSLIILHCGWGPISSRYALPVLPLVWLLSLAGLRALSRDQETRIAGLFPIVLTLCALGQDVAYLRRPARSGSTYWPETTAWLRRNTPPAARLQSLRPASLALLTGRFSDGLPWWAAGREEWLAYSLQEDIQYVVVSQDEGQDGAYRPDGLFAPGLSRVPGDLESWARSSPGVSEVYRNGSEGSVVFRLDQAVIGGTDSGAARRSRR